MEDSGFDSDHKTMYNGSLENEHLNKSDSSSESSAQKMMKKATQMQQKIEKQREAARKAPGGPVLEQPKQKGFLSRNRLIVPVKTNQYGGSDDTQPLVMIETDESEDEFAVPRLSKQAQMEITQQLIKDGYNLDLEPDDEDLDLIPPRPLNQRCVCCQNPYALPLDTSGCVLQ